MKSSCFCHFLNPSASKIVFRIIFIQVLENKGTTESNSKMNFTGFAEDLASQAEIIMLTYGCTLDFLTIVKAC